jgi:hypothetical protein
VQVVDSISNSIVKPSTAEELLTVKDKIKQSELGYLIKTNKLSSRDAREIKCDKRDPIYDYNNGEKSMYSPRMNDIDKKIKGALINL